MRRRAGQAASTSGRRVAEGEVVALDVVAAVAEVREQAVAERLGPGDAGVRRGGAASARWSASPWRVAVGRRGRRRRRRRGRRSPSRWRRPRPAARRGRRRRTLRPQIASAVRPVQRGVRARDRCARDAEAPRRPARRRTRRTCRDADRRVCRAAAAQSALGRDRPRGAFRARRGRRPRPAHGDSEASPGGGHREATPGLRGGAGSSADRLASACAASARTAANERGSDGGQAARHHARIRSGQDLYSGSCRRWSSTA